MTDGRRKLIGDLADADANVRSRAMSSLGISDESGPDGLSHRLPHPLL